VEQEQGGRSWIIRMEEEEQGWRAARRRFGFAKPGQGEEDETDLPPDRVPEYVNELVMSLAAERRTIVENEKLSVRQKRILLDGNRKALSVATGGTTTKTENIVYGILIFGGIVLVTLSLLTAFSDLPKEVTLSFVGTVMGGVIATIAQKLGKI
jgi:hypothetical protein